MAAGIASGVHPDDGMNLILKISQRTREKTSKLMDVLTPRYVSDTKCVSMRYLLFDCKSLFDILTYFIVSM